MATSKGPALGLGASGSIQRTLIFSTWKGRPTIKFSAKVTNPSTAPQKSSRAIIRFLARTFDSLSAGPHASWQPDADAAQISIYNAWSAYNLERWSRFLFPTKGKPANETLDNATIGFLNQAIHGFRVIFTIYRIAANNNWGLAVYRSTNTGFTPALSNCVDCVPWNGSDGFIYTYRPLAIGTHYFRFQTFSIDGKATVNWTNQNSVTITGS